MIPEQFGTADDSALGILRLRVCDPPPLSDFARILTSLDKVYNRMDDFQVGLNQLAHEMRVDRGAGGEPTREQYRSAIKGLFHKIGKDRFLYKYKDLSAGRVRVKRIEIHSPGILEFLGKLNPLEQIRLYLNDRHQRKLALEDQRFDLKMKEVHYYRELATFLKEIGLPDDEIRMAMSKQLIEPLCDLDEAVDSGFVVEAEVENIEASQ